jgi:hypothetical protein
VFGVVLPPAAPPEPPALIATELAAMLPPLPALPWTTTVSPGWMPPTLVETLLVSLEAAEVLTFFVVPWLSVT